MSLRRSLERFLSRSQADCQSPNTPQVFNVTEDIPSGPGENLDELALTSSQVLNDSVSEDRVDGDADMYVTALQQKSQTFVVAANLLGHWPSPENSEDRMVLLFSAVQQVGCHVEYVGEITSLDYDYVRRVMQRMHDAGIWPPIGTVNQPIPMTPEQCADFSIICDEDLHGKGPRPTNGCNPTTEEEA